MFPRCTRHLGRSARLTGVVLGAAVQFISPVARGQAQLPPLPTAGEETPPAPPPSPPLPPRLGPPTPAPSNAPPAPPAPPLLEDSAFPPEGVPPPPPPPLLIIRRTKHAPRYSLWTGARFGIIGFGGGFYGIQAGKPPVEATEWTSDLVTPGASLQADLGVRLGYRFTPFIFYERAILGPGSRFAGDGAASAYSELYGLGLRFAAGDVDTAAFLTEISIGERTVGVSANGQTFTMSGFEYFKLGLGAEIRLSSQLVLSPLASLSTGSMTNTSGSVSFSAAGSTDGNKSPPFANGQSISDQRGYVMLSLACGAHFDLLGK